jgi:Streptomyces sporulation and cell division protein, SsgA
MRGSSGQVTVEVVLDGSSGNGRMTVLELSWRRDDPLAVALTLTAQPDHPALPRGQWVILRDFLRYGLEAATGDGEVRIRPDDRGERVWLELAREGHPCCVALAASVVADFLDQTEAIVPAGEERSEHALDELIERLLQS